MTREEAKAKILEQAKKENNDKYSQTIHLLGLHHIIEEVFDYIEELEAKLKKYEEPVERFSVSGVQLYDLLEVEGAEDSKEYEIIIMEADK